MFLNAPRMASFLLLCCPMLIPLLQEGVLSRFNGAHNCRFALLIKRCAFVDGACYGCFAFLIQHLSPVNGRVHGRGKRIPRLDREIFDILPHFLAGFRRQKERYPRSYEPAHQEREKK